MNTIDVAYKYKHHPFFSLQIFSVWKHNNSKSRKKMHMLRWHILYRHTHTQCVCMRLSILTLKPTKTSTRQSLVHFSLLFFSFTFGLDVLLLLFCTLFFNTLPNMCIVHSDHHSRAKTESCTEHSMHNAVPKNVASVTTPKTKTIAFTKPYQFLED